MSKSISSASGNSNPNSVLQSPKNNILINLNNQKKKWEFNMKRIEELSPALDKINIQMKHVDINKDISTKELRIQLKNDIIDLSEQATAKNNELKDLKNNNIDKKIVNYNKLLVKNPKAEIMQKVKGLNEIAKTINIVTNMVSEFINQTEENINELIQQRKDISKEDESFKELRTDINNSKLEARLDIKHDLEVIQDIYDQVIDRVNNPNVVPQKEEEQKLKGDVDVNINVNVEANKEKLSLLNKKMGELQGQSSKSPGFNEQAWREETNNIAEQIKNLSLKENKDQIVGNIASYRKLLQIVEKGGIPGGPKGYEVSNGYVPYGPITEEWLNYHGASGGAGPQRIVLNNIHMGDWLREKIGEPKKDNVLISQKHVELMKNVKNSAEYKLWVSEQKQELDKRIVELKDGKINRNNLDSLIDNYTKQMFLNKEIKDLKNTLSIINLPKISPQMQQYAKQLTAAEQQLQNYKQQEVDLKGSN